MAPAEFHRGGSSDRLLQDRGYVLGECIGEGAYAKVYVAEYVNGRRRADDPRAKQLLACKMIDGNAAPRDFIRKFFPRELEIMSRINYKFCLRIHSVVQRRHIYFVFMQYCPNGDLLDFIKGNGSLKEKQARIWFAQLLKALNYLQSKGIAHRDLKCENILLTAAYNIKLADFGFARSMMFGETKSETFCGSVSYAAPEILRGKPYDPIKSDIWSAGVVLFVMLNRSLPFDDTNIRKLCEAQMARKWKFRSKVVGYMSKELKDFMFRILEPEPSTRLSARDLWRLPWIQVISRSGEQVTPPPSPVRSVFERNRLFWEEQERRLAPPPSITDEPNTSSDVQLTVVDGQLTVPTAAHESSEKAPSSLTAFPDLPPTTAEDT